MASKRVDRFMKGLARILRKSKDNKPVSLNLLPLEARLNPAPNLLVPSTSAAAPIGFVGGTQSVEVRQVGLTATRQLVH